MYPAHPYKRRAVKKRSRKQNIKKHMFVTALCGFSFLIVSVGLAICLMQSPKALSLDHQALAAYYDSQIQNAELSGEAKKFLLSKKYDSLNMALRAEPYKAELWEAMAMTYTQLNEEGKAQASHKIALKLGIGKTQQQPVDLAKLDD